MASVGTPWLRRLTAARPNAPCPRAAGSTRSATGSWPVTTPPCARSTTSTPRSSTAWRCASSVSPAAEDVSQEVFARVLGATRRRSIPRGAACGPGSGRYPPAVGRPRASARRPGAGGPSGRRAARSPRPTSRRWRRVAHRGARARRARPASRREQRRASAARVLRGQDLPAGCRDPGHPRGDGQVAAAPGAAPDRRGTSKPKAVTW